MSKTISLNIFSASSVKAAQREILAYKQELLAKCEVFINRLADEGIQTAQIALTDEKDTAGLAKYITFTKEVEPDKYGCKAIMCGTNTGIIKSEWRINSQGDTKTADVSPILMAEFGAGLKADKNPRGQEFGMGKGTFPEQTHADNPEGWWYQTTDDVWHHSTGIEPSMPMDKAARAMVLLIADVAKEVFG